MTRLEQREIDTRRKIDFMSGDNDIHPHGASGREVLVPMETTTNCWDTSSMGWRFSEYGNEAGMT